MNDTTSPFLKGSRLGVFGGSGLYSIEGLQNIQELDIETPYGNTSDKILLGELNGIEVVFLARHGLKHTLIPTEIPYLANVWAMRSLDVRWIISASAVGSLQEQIRPLDMVVPDQFIDQTKHRPTTFFGDGAVAHISMADPFCPILSRLIAEIGEALMPEGRQLHHGGTYLCIEGPAFSSKAESNLYRSWGCSVIGMTNHTEARLAREAEIAYTTLAMATDYDCWHPDHASVTVGMVLENLKINAALANQIIKAVAEKIAETRPSSKSHTALKNALMTLEKDVPEKTRLKLDVLTKAYWGN